MADKRSIFHYAIEQQFWFLVLCPCEFSVKDIIFSELYILLVIPKSAELLEGNGHIIFAEESFSNPFKIL